MFTLPWMKYNSLSHQIRPRTRRPFYLGLTADNNPAPYLTDRGSGLSLRLRLRPPESLGSGMSRSSHHSAPDCCPVSSPEDARHPVCGQVQESWGQHCPWVWTQPGRGRGRGQLWSRVQVPESQGLGGDQEGDIHSHRNKRRVITQETPEPEKPSWPKRAATRWENKWDPINRLGSGVRRCWSYKQLQKEIKSKVT